MSAADREPAAAAGAGAPDAPAPESGDGAEPLSMPAAGVALVAALRHLLVALPRLAAAESRLMLAGIPLFFIAAVALVAFAVSLWVCLVALIGWALVRGTHSLGLALGLLVVTHAILVFGVWSLITYSIRQATFPKARSELRLVGLSLLHDLRRITGAAPATAHRAPAADTQKEGNP